MLQLILSHKYYQLCLSVLLSFLALLLTWATLAHAQSPGDLDTSFGNAGVVTTSVTSGSDGGFSMILQPDGKIVVAGFSAANIPGTQHHFAMLRYDTDGNLDADFKGSGVVTTEIDHQSLAYSVTSDSGGRIIVAGYSQPESGTNFAVARYTISGALDTDFNNTGIMTTSLGYPWNIGRAAAVQPDGKVVVAGQIGGFSADISDVGLVRYTITGSLDAEFNETGIVTTSIGGWDDVSPDHAVAIQPDGKILVAGSFSGFPSAGGGFLARYTITGSLDTSFNGTGIVTETGYIYINVLALQPDGKIVATGSGTFALVRYNPDGTLDNSFNGTGIITPPLIAIRAATLQPDGKIVIGGDGGFNYFALVRYNQDGTLDTTFGNSGIITTDITSNEDTINSLAVQPDGKIVAAGWANAGANNSYFAVARYLGGSYTHLPIILKNQ